MSNRNLDGFIAQQMARGEHVSPELLRFNNELKEPRLPTSNTRIEKFKERLFLLLLVSIFFGLIGVGMYFSPPPDPCQPSRDIHYECMPGGALNK